MKAMIWTAYGPPEVLQLRDIETPSPKDDEILVKVLVSNIFPGDCELRRFEIAFPWSVLVRVAAGLRKPKAHSILGQEYAGVVEKVGKNVTRFKIGDRVFGAVEPFSRGCYAEYVVSKGKALITMPSNVSFEQAAAATVGGLNALHCLRVAGVQAGGPPKRILMNGAGGSIGTMAIQLAKHFSAELTVVDSADKLAKLRELGADHVIDYRREDFTERGEVYDAVFDIVGKSQFFRTLKCVKPGGYFIIVNPPFKQLLLRFCWDVFSKRKIRFPLTGYSLAHLEQLKALMQAGKVRPVIDRRYNLGDAAQAHRYIETGKRIGNVVLTVGDGVDRA